MKYLMYSLLVGFILFLSSCKNPDTHLATYKLDLNPDAYNVGFLVTNGVYNTELTAPYDIFHHTRFRDSIRPMNVFTVSNQSSPIQTFEGLRITPDYNFIKDSIPAIDILVIPSAEHHLDTDLENIDLIKWIRVTGEKATFVTSHCDGAFMLAKAGLLDNVASTTFPSDIDAYRMMFPKLDIRDSVLFVHDDKYITSVGGAKSFEAALYLCEVLYGNNIAQQLAKGLVIDWDKDKISYTNISKIKDDE